MEEADARLQEVVASLLNEHGGSHEQALRQTFACLHNSGLYEAQSAAEQEQREQQVLAVFRSFPFRAPAAPTGTGGGTEETQAPPPAYHTLAREPEEAGEVTPTQADPENVGEDARAQPAPEALLPLNPVVPQEQQEQQQDSLLQAAPGPEVSHQGSGAPQDVNLPEQQPPGGAAALIPESFASAGSGTGDGEAVAAAAAVAVGAAAAPVPAAAPVTAEGLPAGGGGGVEETKGGERNEEARGVETAGFPETGGAVAEEACVEGTAQQLGSRLGAEEETGGGVNGGVVAEAGSGEELANGVQGGPAADPESTRQEGSTEPPPPEPPLANGGGAFAPHAAEPAVPNPGAPESEEGAYGVARDMEARGASSAARAEGAAAAPVPPAGAGAAAAAAPVTTAVTEPHLKTAGQPLTHANRAESPTGMSTDLQDKLKALKLRRKHRFVTMRIDGTEVVAETVAAPAEGPAELKVALPYSDCRYAVYDQEIVTADGRKANKLFFFTWVPHNATPHNKMAYSHGKVTVRQRLEGLYDVAASSFGDIEIALGLVDEDEEDSDIDF
eukprot:g9352.t1